MAGVNKGATPFKNSFLFCIQLKLPTGGIFSDLLRAEFLC